MEIRYSDKLLIVFEHEVKQWEAGWVQNGIETGIGRGIIQSLVRRRELLCHQAELKFDVATAQELARRLATVTDAARFIEVGGWIIDYDTGAELFARFAQTDSDE